MRTTRYRNTIIGGLIALIVLFAYLQYQTMNLGPMQPDDEFFSSFDPTKEFMIVVLPDTQKDTKTNERATVFTTQTRWIAEHKEQLNIIFVSHVGDIVNNPEVIAQWERANTSMSILEEGGVAYGVVTGNHDLFLDGKTGPKNYTNYHAYFPASRFEHTPHWGGTDKEEKNQYFMIEAFEETYLFLGLDFCPDKKSLAWANSVLKNNTEAKAIVTTHGYINLKGERNVHVCGNTEYIWEELLEKHQNTFLILSGHIHGEAYRNDTHKTGTEIHQILSNYQQTPATGWLRLLRFNTETRTIHVTTYSPHLKQFLKSERSEYWLEY